MAHIFTDAAGEPPEVCGLVHVAARWHGMHLSVSESDLNMFAERGDQQIMGLERLAFVLNLCTFPDILHGCLLHCHIDNQSALGAFVKGAATTDGQNHNPMSLHRLNPI